MGNANGAQIERALQELMSKFELYGTIFNVTIALLLVGIYIYAMFAQ
jgi:hypothetical protein